MEKLSVSQDVLKPQSSETIKIGPCWIKDMIDSWMVLFKIRLKVLKWRPMGSSTPKTT